MRHLLSMRTPVRLGVTDGAIDVTSAAVGKVSDSRRGYSVRGASLSALAPKEDILGAPGSELMQRNNRKTASRGVSPKFN